jgi:hypothetical protein
MKYVLAFLQFALFLLLFFVGSVILPPFGILPEKVIALSAHRGFVYDGVVLALLVYLLLLAIEAARKTLRSSGVRTTVAFVVAVVLGLVMKFGFKDL